MKYYKSFIERMERFVDLTPDSVVVDLGAWKGEFTGWFATKVKQVVSVEPVLINYERIPKPQNVIPIYAAIGKTTGLGKIYIAHKTHKNSLMFKKHFGTETPLQKTLVIRWDDLVDILGIKEVDFVKVNIEGSEEDLLVGMTKVFPKKMIIEHHTKNNVTNLPHLYKLLRGNGYRIIKEELSDIYVEHTS